MARRDPRDFTPRKGHESEESRQETKSFNTNPRSNSEVKPDAPRGNDGQSEPDLIDPSIPTNLLKSMVRQTGRVRRKSHEEKTTDDKPGSSIRFNLNSSDLIGSNPGTQVRNRMKPAG